MEQTKEQIIQTLEADLKTFSDKVEYYRHNKRKLIIPKHQNQLIASASVMAYLTERLKQFKGE